MERRSVSANGGRRFSRMLDPKNNRLAARIREGADRFADGGEAELEPGSWTVIGARRYLGSFRVRWPLPLELVPECPFAGRERTGKCGVRAMISRVRRRSTVEFRRFAEDASPFRLANALVAIEAIRRTQCATRAMQAGPPRENRAFGTRSPDLQSALEPGPSLVRLRSGSLPSRFAFRSPAALRRVVALQGSRGERPVPVRTASAPPAPTMVRNSVSLLCFSRRCRQAALRMRGPSPVSACRPDERRSGRPCAARNSAALRSSARGSLSLHLNA